MQNAKWAYMPQDGLVLQEGTDITVFYTEDINPKVIEFIVKENNAGRSFDDICFDLSFNTKITPEEVSFIQSEIEKYTAFVKDSVPVSFIAKTVDGSERAGITIAPIDENEKMAKATAAKLAEPISVIEKFIAKTIAEEKPSIVVTPVEEPKTRKQRASNQTAPVEKVLTAEEYIQSLEEKIKLSKILAEVQLPEIPKELSKDGRTILIDFNKEFSLLINGAIQKIQKI